MKGRNENGTEIGYVMYSFLIIQKQVCTNIWRVFCLSGGGGGRFGFEREPPATIYPYPLKVEPPVCEGYSELTLP